MADLKIWATIDIFGHRDKFYALEDAAIRDRMDYLNRCGTSEDGLREYAEDYIEEITVLDNY